MARLAQTKPEITLPIPDACVLVAEEANLRNRLLGDSLGRRKCLTAENMKQSLFDSRRFHQHEHARYNPHE